MTQSAHSKTSPDVTTVEVEEVMALLGHEPEELLTGLGVHEILSNVGELFFRIERARHQGAFVIARDEALSHGRTAWRRIWNQLKHDKNLDPTVFVTRSGDPRELIPQLSLMVASALGIAPNSVTCFLTVALLIHPLE